MHQPIEDKPATWEDLKVGTKVRCIFHNERLGKTGTIVRVDRNDHSAPIVVEWDDKFTNLHHWGSPTSFTVFGYDTSVSVPTSAGTPDITDWKTWRDHNKSPDECACGIRREMCSYHRS